MTESISDFRKLLKDLDGRHPKDPTLANMGGEVQNEFVGSALAKVGQVASKVGAGALKAGATAVKAAAPVAKAALGAVGKGAVGVAKGIGNAAKETAVEIGTKVGGKLVDRAMKKPLPLPQPVPQEDIDVPVRSAATSAAIQAYRLFAGLDEREMTPRDPGMSGSVRHTSAYLNACEAKTISTIKIKPEDMPKARSAVAVDAMRRRAPKFKHKTEPKGGSRKRITGDEG